MRKVVLIVLVFYLLSACLFDRHKQLVTEPVQQATALYWIDFQAGFHQDTVTLIFNSSDTLIRNHIITTSQDGSYFTGLRVKCYEDTINKDCNVRYENRNQFICKNDFEDTLFFSLIINNKSFSIKEEVKDTKVFSISYDRQNYVPVVSKYTYFFSYQ